MNKEISKKIHNANVLMTILIVALHSTNVGDIRLNPIRTICDMAVPTFFCISAFLYYQEWQPTWQFYKKKIYSRLFSLLIPYIVYNIIFYFYYIVKIHILHTCIDKDIPIAPFEAILCIIMGVPDGVLWFIQVLLGFTLIAPFLGILIRTSRFSIFPIIIVGFILHYYTSYYSLLYWIPCYAFGCYCAFYQDELKQIHKSVQSSHIYLSLGGSKSFFIVFIIISCICFYETRHQTLYYIYRITVPIGLLWVYAENNIVPEWIVDKIKPYTFYMYCMHIGFIYTIFGVLTGSGISPNHWFLWPFLLTFTTTIILLLLTGKILRKTPVIWGLLTGFRNKADKYPLKQKTTNTSL